jgi:cytidylate kinase
MSANETGDSGKSAQRRPVVTMAALYGAGGSAVGPRVAERLGVEFLDRAIPASVARRMGLPEAAVASYDEQPRSRMGRLVESLARVPNPAGDESAEHLDLDEDRMQAEIEEFLARASASGGVVLGRGGAVVLGSVPGALHVLLTGPRQARVEQAMRIEGVDQKTAEQRLEANDRARREYVRQRYGVDGEDPSLYHLVIDSCAFDLDACVDFIATASRLRMQHAERHARS